MKNTVNYGLNMPDLDDFYNINDFNENAEIIDDVMHENELAINALSEKTQAALDGISEKIGNTDDTGATASTGTAMGKLNVLIKNDDLLNVIANSRSIQAEIEDVIIAKNSSEDLILEIDGACEIMSMYLNARSTAPQYINFKIEIDDYYYEVHFTREGSNSGDTNLVIPLPENIYGLISSMTSVSKSNVISYINSLGRVVFTDANIGNVENSFLKKNSINEIKMTTASQDTNDVITGNFRAKNKLKISYIEGSARSNFTFAIAKIKG